MSLKKIVFEQILVKVALHLVKQNFSCVGNEFLLVAKFFFVELLCDVLRHFDQAFEWRYHFMGDATASNLEHFILGLQFRVLFDLTDVSKIEN